MVSAERINVTLTGGAPWGFRLAGGGALPLTINKIRKKSQAHEKGLKEGDAVISINGIPVHDKSQDEALELVENAGDTVSLEIFRGDIDELSRDKPKKPIQIGGGNSSLILTATVDDVSDSARPVPIQGDTSSELILTASVDNVSSEAFETPATNSTNQGFTATIGDVSQSDFAPFQDNSSAGFTLSATVDDVTSSANMVDSITAELGDVTSSSLMSSTNVKSLQASSALSPSMTQSFGESRSPRRLSPNPSRGSTSPKVFSPVAFSPKPSGPSPQPINRLSPRLPAAVPPPVSPKPSPVSITSSTATFDDGIARREVTREQRVQERENGYGVTVLQRETTNTSNTKTSPFVKSRASAFNVPQQQSTSTTTRKQKTTTVVKSVEKKGPEPFSNPVTSTTTQQEISTSNNTSRSNQGPVPVFKPSKFVPGQGKRDIPGLFTPTSPKVEVNVHAMYRDGKENVQPPQPLFQVKNILSEKSKTKGRDIWKPNVWLPGQKPSEKKAQQAQQEKQAIVSDDFSPYSSFPIPVVQPGQSLKNKSKRNLTGSQRGRTNDVEDEYVYEDEQDYHKRESKLHIFAPPVEMHNLADSGYYESPYSPYLPYTADGEPIYFDEEDGPSSPDSTLARRKKKLYADSAFYDAPGKSYPTIGEQIKLCKRIAQSLTSQANRRARGAKMFMKRKRKSSKWIHEGHSEWSSSAGDVANLNDLDSELSPDEGGSKPLFYFKIPNLKNRISNKDRKMALTQEQFEKLRLQSAKCDHRMVSPNACFDLVADLKASKGKGGRMFEKRRSRAEKYVVDENNARRSAPRPKLDHVLNQPVRQETTPWNAAMRHGGDVEAAFSHLNEMERNQKLNQILRYTDPRKQQTTPMPPAITPTETRLFHTSLRSDSTGFVLKGKNFNRFAKGWTGGGEYPVAEQLHHIPSPSKATGTPQPLGSPQYGNYNTRIKAWQQPGESPYVQPPSASSSLDRRQDKRESRRQDAWQTPQEQPRYDNWQTGRQGEVQNRPTSWQSDNYDTHNYKDEYDYSYVPVDYKFNQSDYPAVAYMQPIIPGTDL